MLLRMKLEEAVEDNDESAIDALNQQVINESEELLRGMSELFERLNNEDGERNSILAQARMDLNATKYIRNLIHDSSGLQRPDA